MFFLLSLLLAAAPVPECTTDGECAVMTRCACDCCPPAPQAATKKAAEAERLRCARLGPCAPPGCDRQACPPTGDARRFEAVCQAGRCTRKARAP